MCKVLYFYLFANFPTLGWRAFSIYSKLNHLSWGGGENLKEPRMICLHFVVPHCRCCFTPNGIMGFAYLTRLLPPHFGLFIFRAGLLSCLRNEQAEEKKRGHNWWAVKWWANKIMVCMFYHFVSNFRALKKKRLWCFGQAASQLLFDILAVYFSGWVSLI